MERRDVLAGLVAIAGSPGGAVTATQTIDDLTGTGLSATTGTDWALVSDRVMGGVSSGRLDRVEVAGRPALRLTGKVSLENEGGFLQMALDLQPGGDPIDAAGWRGIALDVIGDGARYNLHLRTAAVERPWQSYRLSFVAPQRWTRVRLPFAQVAPHRVAVPFDPATLRRIGLVAIGQAREVDLALGYAGFYA